MRENNSLKTIRFDVNTLYYIMRVLLVGGHFLLSFESRLNFCDKSKEQGNSGGFCPFEDKSMIPASGNNCNYYKFSHSHSKRAGLTFSS